MTDPVQRVLIVLVSAGRGGVEEHVLALLKGFHGRGRSTAVAAPRPVLRSMDSELVSWDGPRFPMRATSPWRVAEMSRFWKAVRSFRPDLVHFHMFRTVVLGAPLARLARVPAVVETCHVPELWRRGALTRSFVVDRCVVRLVDRVIAVSESVKRFLLERKRYPPDRIRVITNAVDLERFRPPPPPMAEAARRELGLCGSGPVLGVVGRLEEQKGHEYLLKALPRILEAHPNARVLFVGEGTLRASLEARVAAAGLAQAVIFTGFETDVSRALAAMDVLVLPSLYEGMPLSVLEALATARPVVATAVDGTCEAIQDGESGLLVPSSDPDALARSVLRLLSSADLRARLGQAGRRRVEREFRLEQMLDATEAVYAEARARRDRRRGR